MTPMAFIDTLTLKPVSPFSLDLSTQIFVAGDRHIRSYMGNVFQQVLRVNKRLVLMKLTSNGGIDDPHLNVDLLSSNQITTTDKSEAEKIINRIFNLGYDLSHFYGQVENDHTLGPIAQQLYGYKILTTPTVFESLVDAIVEQQISIKVARTIEERLAIEFGEKLIISDEYFFAFPTPIRIVESNIRDIQQTGLSKRKAEYIYNIAKMIVDGELDLEQMENEANADCIIKSLDEVKGIGVWTAELTMLRGMQRWDILPADDFGIRRAISTYYCGGRPIKAAEAREIGKAWGKWKGLAAFYLITAEDKGIRV
jgi:DNA-3-methyladenine glycosylase II